MTSRRKQARTVIIEPHPKDYKGYEQLSIIIHGREARRNGEQTVIDTEISLCIVDNKYSLYLDSFTLHVLNVDRIKDEVAKSILEQWDTSIPLSVFCDKHNFTPKIKHAWMTLQSHQIVRIIGNVYKFETNQISKRTQKVKRIQHGIPKKINTIG